MADTPWSVAAAGLMAPAVKVGAQSTAPSADSSGGLSLDRDAFMQLLLAQMRNQDPMNPMQSEEFLGQLAQLNTLDQMWRMNDNLQNFMSQQQLLQASAMIGKTVQATGTDGALIEGTVGRVSVLNDTVMIDVGGMRVALDKIIAVF
jgi:flagellar basal-body rod modification protein FlgD